MAQWVNRPRSDGGVSVQVKWRMDGRWQGETFTDLRLAAEFRAAVEAGGHRWPDGWVKGEGWQTQAPLTPAEPVAVVTLADVATGAGGYFEEQQRRVRRGKLTPHTLHRSRRLYELHLLEPFGAVPFVEVDEQRIGDWIDAQLEAGAAPKSIRHRHGLLFSVVQHGQRRMRLRTDNPCQLSELPDLDAATSATRQVRFLRHGEWALLRSCLNPDTHLLMDLQLSTGMRWGELSALRVGDVHLHPDSGDGGDGVQANVHIVRAWSKRSPQDQSLVRWDEQENLSWVLGPPKSRRSRWAVVTGDVASRLGQALSGRDPDAYVFQTRYGNPWRYPDFHTDRWLPARRMAAQHGLTRHITAHMLRHTTVVWSLAEGVPIQVVSEMIGHTSLQMTYDIYGGLVNLHDPVMAQAMARAMLLSDQAPRPSIAPQDTVRPLRPGGRAQRRRRAS